MNSTYVWWNELVSQFIEGAADAFKMVLGGSIGAQAADITTTGVSLKQLGISMLIGGGLYVADFIKKKPLPTVSLAQPVPQINPPPLAAPTPSP